MTLLTVTEYRCHTWPTQVALVVSNIRSFPHSWHITGFVNRANTTGVTSGTETAYPSGVPEFTPYSGVRVARSLVFYVIRCKLLFVLFSFWHCVVCPSIYGFWLPFVSSNSSLLLLLKSACLAEEQQMPI